MLNERKRRRLDGFVWTMSAIFAGLLLTDAARAGSHIAPITNTVYRAECGSCHLAYPPQLLSAASWKKLIGGLDQHFGTNATVDAKAHAEINAYLTRAAGPENRFGTAALKISQTPWFRREHDEVSVALWTKPAVKSAANCSACHLQAERGDYSERSIRVPR